MRLIDSRKVGSEIDALSRDLLAGFFELCMQSGLDRVLVELGEAHPPVDIADASTLFDHPTLRPVLVTQLRTIDLDGGGPRNVKPRQLADCLVTALGLTLADEVDRTIKLDDTVRTQVTAAIAGVINAELAVPTIRDTIIAKSRARCEEQYLGTFDKIAAQLDERAMRLIKQPKVPLDASQSVQRVLSETRNAVFDQMGRTAIDRAKAVIERANPEAAARIDEPVTLRLTPRDVAILRIRDPRIPKMPAAVVASLLDSLTELARLAWSVPERPVRPYGASQTFNVGDLIEHPKFGRGEVTGSKAQRIDVEFPDGVVTLVHVPRAK